MLFEISKSELDEVVRKKYGGSVDFEEGKVTITAAMGTVKFTLYAPEVPLKFSEKFEIRVSMSLAVRLFLGKVREELKRRRLHEAVKVYPDRIEVDLTKMKGNELIEWMKERSLKKFEITDEKLHLEI